MEKVFGPLLVNLKINYNMIEKIKEEIKHSINIKQKILNNDKLLDDIKNLSITAANCLKNGGKIILCGNGGSFADAQHISAEFTSKLRFDRDSLPAITLGTNSSSLTAIGNDYNFDQIFKRELSSLYKPEDLFIPISTSGRSSNIIEAIKFAKTKNLTTIGLTGNKGGDMNRYCNIICIPSDMTEKIQESHIMIGHIVCSIVENLLFKNVNN